MATVSTPSGALLGASTRQIAAFKGIPYAAPPFGPNRFLPPRPVQPWQGVRDALGYGATAPKAPYPAPADQLLPEVDIGRTAAPSPRAPARCRSTTAAGSPATASSASPSTIASARRDVSSSARGDTANLGR
ncbi:Carboxylesterase family protein [Streptomyces melanosporofaciens]|uniref:Carboxylesterase family protein n=1 Tax=Streptomyces melanosporofaciens TaxID=67327 RepID=A0A1H5A2N3_STRMJ|nr:Carboxylesterase family protein [Streptomyces melanosporofaciens]